MDWGKDIKVNKYVEVLVFNEKDFYAAGSVMDRNVIRWKNSAEIHGDLLQMSEIIQKNFFEKGN